MGQLKTKEENIQELDNRIIAFSGQSETLKAGNVNDQAVAAILEEKVNAMLVKQKEELESDQSE